MEDAVWMIGAERTVLYANDELLDELDLKVDEVIDTPYEVLLPDILVNTDDRTAYQESVEAILSGDQDSAHLEFDLELDGRPLTIDAHLCALQMDGDRAVVSVAREITRQKQVETELLERETLLEQAQQIGDLGHWAWTVGTDEQTWSDETFRILGMDPEEEDEAGYDVFMDRVHPDDRERIERTVEEALERTVEETGDGSEYKIEHRIIRPDGEERVVQQRGVVERDENGDPVRLIGIVHDVTERKRLEEALQEEQARESKLFAAVLEQSPDAVLIASLPDREILRANREARRQMGYEEEELVGMDITNITGVSESEVEERIARLEAEEHVIKFESENRRKDGTTYPAEIAMGLVEHGGDTFLVDISRDITARKREETAEEEFLAMMSHELKSPVFPITGYIEMLQDEQFGPLTDEQREKLDIIYRNAQDLNKLVNDMLDTSRLQMDRLDLDIQNVDLADITRNILDDMEPLAQDHGAELVLEQEGDTGLACDPARIDQVLENIVRNAIQYGKPDEPNTVTVAISGDEDTVTATVSDEGLGMTEEQISHLFDLFFRAKDAASKGETGVGLGLPVAKGIVDLHGGTIDVESEPGKGTTFTVTLPRSQPAE